MWNYLSAHSEFLFGILVTAICAVVPFLVASIQLAKETKRLRKLITLIARGIEETGLATFRRDANGEFIGMIFSGTISEKLVVSASAETDPFEK